MSGSFVMPDGSNFMLMNFETYASSGTPYCSPIETAIEKASITPGERGALLRGLQEDLAEAVVGVRARRDVALGVAHLERRGDRRARHAAGACAPAARARAEPAPRPSSSCRPTAAARPCSCRGRSRPPSARASSTRRTAARPPRPSTSSGMFTVFEMAPEMNGCAARHHPHVAHVVDRLRAHRGVEHRVVLGLQVRRVHHRVVLGDVGDDVLALRRRVAELARARAAPSGSRTASCRRRPASSS